MISLLLSMLAARRGQALVVFLLSAFATAAAVTGPAYLAAADRAVVAAELDAADRGDRTVSLSIPDVLPGEEAGLLAVTGAVLDLPGFRTVYTVQMPMLGLEPVATDISYLVFREDVCANLRMVAGRCLMSPNEVVIGADTARRLDLAPGTPVTITWAEYVPPQRIYRPGGAPAEITVVGVYEPVDPDALYWGRTPYFVPGALDAYREPVFTSRYVVDAMDRRSDYRGVDALAEADALGPDRLAGLSEQLTRLAEQVRADGAGYVYLSDDVGPLLERISSAQALTRQVVPVAAVPLVILCLFVVFVAVAAGTMARRTELGLIALRGIPRRTRWTLAAGEPAAAIALGAPVGYLLGSVAVGLLAGLRLEEGRFAPVTSGATVLAGCATFVGALLAVLAAQRRELASPVVELLRRVPARSRLWTSLLAETVMVALTVVAVVQLRLFDSQLIGVSLLVPALIGVTVALLAARVVAPLTGRLGAVALRRGRLGPALGLLHLARQPASQRLFTLLTVTVVLTGYAASAFDVARQSRAALAEVRSGADRVLTLLPVDAGTLLTAVRTVDPTGEYAMAVGFADTDADAPALLADTSALAATARWRPEFGPAGPADVAEALRRPAATAPITVDGTEISVDLVVVDAAPEQPDPTADSGQPDPSAEPGQPDPRGTGPADDVRFTVHLRSPSGGAAAEATFARLGRHTYRIPVECADGCQLAGLSVRLEPDTAGAVDPDTEVDPRVREVTLTEFSVDGERLLGPAELTDEQRWRDPSGGPSEAGPDGLRLLAGGAAPDPWALPADTPYPLPAVTALADNRPPGLNPTTALLPTGAQLTSEVDPVPALPALGDRGFLVDMEYAVRAVPEKTGLETAQVWLGPRAPADIAEQLDAAGLTVTGEFTPEQVRAGLDRQAPALAIWFHLLAAVLAVILAGSGMVLLAMVERRRRAEDLTALRTQGLPSRSAAGSLRWSGLPAVLLAAATGLGGALLAWWLSGSYLPVAVEEAVPLAPVRWPQPVAVLLPVIGVMLLFGAVALALGRALRVRD
ncbi:FtsX-like permease family protein [Solwaraspora sp. WMMB762]|uniref:FtsX-like permease family protein n=1 Tax=Solwaraspora sp. WMMB762 TaxID=3404120 RepID=UPI003B925127